MNVNTDKMMEYSDFLEEFSNQIINLCDNIGNDLMVAIQCMDQESGRVAAQRLAQNIENIKNNVPISNAASGRIVRAKKYIDSAGDIFRR